MPALLAAACELRTIASEVLDARPQTSSVCDGIPGSRPRVCLCSRCRSSRRSRCSLWRGSRSRLRLRCLLLSLWRRSRSRLRLRCLLPPHPGLRLRLRLRCLRRRISEGPFFAFDLAPSFAPAVRPIGAEQKTWRRASKESKTIVLSPEDQRHRWGRHLPQTANLAPPAPSVK